MKPLDGDDLPQSHKLKTEGYETNKLVHLRQAIALISDHADPAAEIGVEEAGGQNVYVRQLGETLASLGWQVDMFTRKVDPKTPAIVQHSPHCRTIRLVAGPEQFIPRDEIFQFMPQFVQAFEAFRLKEAIHYPLVHTNYWLSGWIGLQLKKIHKIQLVHTYHSLGVVKYKVVPNLSPIADTRLSVEKQILEQADCVIANSPQEQEYLRTLVSQKGHIKVIPCGTDNYLRTVSKEQARAKLGLDAAEEIVLCVARFDPRKGIETAVRACAKSRAKTIGNLRLVIVGGSCPGRIDEQERKRIEQIVQEVGFAERTVFAGRVDHNVLPFYYSAADVCVIPSYYEPFGLVAIEAMACGTPVVASNVGGLKFTVLPEQTGLLAPPQDTVAFATAIDKILLDKQFSKQLSTQASVLVRERFSLVSIVSQLSNLYQYLIAQSIERCHC
jgi:D-inositol-3-phosphate glycosyltransferase